MLADRGDLDQFRAHETAALVKNAVARADCHVASVERGVS
jgi:hypothetical protein